MTDTVYVYGKASDRSNLAGRLASRTDASGTINYMYGKLGETTKETRKISSHIDGFKKDRTATMEYKSDYLGRMQEIVYPDGECVEYAYDYGGNVCGVSGKTKDGNDFSYVKDIGYDEYGQRNFIEYGNGVKTDYEYDSERRWLSSIKTENKYGSCYQNIEYKFDTLGNILSYTNDCLNAGAYKTSQSYTYDALGQLTSVSGSTEHNPYRASQPVHVSEYKQNFVFDEAGLGRMMNKTSSEVTLTGSRNGDDLNYAIDYVYAKGFAHRLERAGNRFYKYDANGNVTQEEYDGLSESDSREVTVTDYGNDVYGVDSAWGYFETDNATTKVRQERHYRRTYVWDVRNRLTESHDSTNDVYYVYGEDGMRTNKYTRNAETIYFCNFWTWHKDGGSELDGGKNSKHIFLGTERLVTKVNSANRPTDSEEMNSQYFYHSDHLGSAQLVTNHKGEVYQRIEYTPYGETWIDMRTNITALYDVPYRFTAKELDKETGLYYYGARYLDPKYSRWISTDPALGEYIPAAGKANAKDMANLPGMGGIFNHINGNLYHYAANNPVKYTDSDGNFIINNALLGDKTKAFAFKEGKDSFYLNGKFQPTIFSNSFDRNPGFPMPSCFEKNIGFSQKLENALLQADKFKNDNNPNTKAKINAKATLTENGIYEIKITVSSNISFKKIDGVVAYAGENEIMTDGKIDQQKIDAIANCSINTVMGWKNDKQNMD